jgi:nitrogen-specific signal transduction histidine kinase
MVVDSALTVQAVSARAEQALAVSEHQVVNRHLTELLIPGESDSVLWGSLAGAITRAACGIEERPRRFIVRPSHTFGVRMVARIAACGPPPAALLVLDAPARTG